MCSPDPTPKSKQCLENISFGGWISERCAPLIQPQKENNAWKILFLGVGSWKDVLPWSNPKKKTMPGKYYFWGLDLGKMCSPDPTPKSKQCLANISFGGWISERCAPLIQPQKVNNAWKILVLGGWISERCAPHDPTPKSKQCLENISFVVGSRKDVLPWSNPKK